MFLNLSNHPSSAWGKEQLAAAAAFGDIRDIPFPAIPAEADEDRVQHICDALVEYIKANFSLTETTIHIMGEMTSTCYMVGCLKEAGYNCVASTTQRNVTEGPNGEKISRFVFVRFREYR